MKFSVFMLSLIVALFSSIITTSIIMIFISSSEAGGSVVRAERFEVVDAQGRTKAYLGGPAGNDSLAILDAQGNERILLRLLADGTASFFMADGQGQGRVTIHVNAIGSNPTIKLYDAEGNVRQIVSIPPSPRRDESP